MSRMIERGLASSREGVPRTAASVAKLANLGQTAKKPEIVHFFYYNIQQSSY